MEYIRLESGIYKVHETESKSLRVKVAYWARDGIVSIIRKDKVIERANTIEELCDAMVVKYSDEPLPRVIDMEELLKSCKHTRIKLQEHISFLFETFGKKIEYIVGAIWYGEGNLKAVAKFKRKENYGCHHNPHRLRHRLYPYRHRHRHRYRKERR